MWLECEENVSLNEDAYSVTKTFASKNNFITTILISHEIFIELINSRSKRQDVMYVNVGGAPADNACPSIADSSAVSLAQMSFLAM